MRRVRARSSIGRKLSALDDRGRPVLKPERVRPLRVCVTGSVRGPYVVAESWRLA